MGEGTLNLAVLTSLLEKMPPPVPMMRLVGHPDKLRELRQRIPIAPAHQTKPPIDITFHSPTFSFVESEYCMERKQVRFPRSKRKRIRKKWAKQDKNFAMVPAVYIIDEKALQAIIPRIWENMGMPIVAQIVRDHGRT